MIAQLSRRAFGVILTSALFLVFSSSAGASMSEMQKIDALLEAVRDSGITFIRNGTEYSAHDAYAHLQKKLRTAQRSLFAPPKEEWTAMLFIEKVASRSSVSGEHYLVRTLDGKVVKARSWLVAKLREIESR